MNAQCACADLKKMAEENEAVGDSSTNLFRNIQHAAKELMRIVLQCRVNAKQVEDWNARDTHLPVLCALSRLDIYVNKDIL